MNGLVRFRELSVPTRRNGCNDFPLKNAAAPYGIAINDTLPPANDTLLQSIAGWSQFTSDQITKVTDSSAERVPREAKRRRRLDGRDARRWPTRRTSSPETR